MTRSFRDLADWSNTTPAQLVQVHLAKCGNTARGYREDLAAFAAWLELGRGDAALPKAALTLIDNGRAHAKRLLINWINDMRGRHLSASTIRRRVASIKSLISAAADPDVEIIAWNIGRLANLPAPSRVRDCTGPDMATVDRMMTICEHRDDAKGARDKALVGMMYWHGLRANEVLSIRMADVDLDTQTPKVRILAKRGQGRVDIKLCHCAADAIGTWIERRGDEEGPLFVRCKRYGRQVMTTPLTYWGLRGVVRDLGGAAGGHCWPHALRHAAVSHLAMLTDDSPIIGCALSRHRDVRAWAMYQDRKVSHVSAAEILSRRLRVRSNPQSADNQCW